MSFEGKHPQHGEKANINNNQHLQRLSALLSQQEKKVYGFDHIQAQIDEVFPGWKIVKEMGRGTHGAVYKIKHEDNGIYVVKLFSKSVEKDFRKEKSMLLLLETSGIPQYQYSSVAFGARDYFCLMSNAGFATLGQFKMFLQTEKEVLTELDLMSYSILYIVASRP